MVSLIIVLGLILALALGQFAKGSLIKGFTLLMGAVIGVCVSLGFYEMVAGFITGFLGTKAFAIAAALLFAFPMVLTIEAGKRLLPAELSLSHMPDKIGGAAFGALTGYITAGMLLIVIGLLPYSFSWLYVRYPDKISNPPQPKNAILNPDGFVSGLFSMVSSGSLSSSNSFSVLHADFPDELAINRLKLDSDVSPYAQPTAVEASNPSLIKAPEDLKLATKNGDDADVKSQAGKTLMIARFKISGPDLDEEQGSGKFMPGQIRLIVRAKDAADSDSEGIRGSGNAVYPAGLISGNNFIPVDLDEEMDISKVGEKVIELAYYVPADSEPVLIQFKGNSADFVKLGVMKPAAPKPADNQAPAEETSEKTE